MEIIISLIIQLSILTGINQNQDVTKTNTNQATIIIGGSDLNEE